MDPELTMSILGRLEALEHAIYRDGHVRGPAEFVRDRPGDRPQCDWRGQQGEGRRQDRMWPDQHGSNEKRLVDLVVRLVAEHTDAIVARRLEQHLEELVRRWPPREEVNQAGPADSVPTPE
jgi:hypothetical protein